VKDKPTLGCDQLINIMPDPFVVIDRNYNIVAANSAYCERFGYDSTEVVGKKCHAVSHHSDRPCSEHGEHCPLIEVLETRQPTQVMHIHYDHDNGQEHVQLHAHPLLGEDGEVEFIGETIYQVAAPQGEHQVSLIGQAQPLLRMASLLQRVSPTNTAVLLQGEVGSGRALAARYIHHYSKRVHQPFVVLDCLSMSENLIESELFGYEKGAFTGAAQRKKGLFETANQGTLFINEISTFSMALQTKLLRALETRQIRRIGGTEPIAIDVRIITATSKDLSAVVGSGKFRQDLFYRLSAFPVQVPALSQRKDDIPRLAEYFMSEMQQGDEQLPLAVEVIEKLMGHEYRGNIRELRQVIERAAILAVDESLRPEHIVFDDNPEPALTGGQISSAVSPVRILSRRHGRLNDEAVIRALELARGHRARAAEILGVSERTLYRYINRLKKESDAQTAT